MPLIQLVIYLIVVGVLLWAVNEFIPMEARIKQILNIVVVIAVVLWLLQVFGVLASLNGGPRVDSSTVQFAQIENYQGEPHVGIGF